MTIPVRAEARWRAKERSAGVPGHLSKYHNDDTSCSGRNARIKLLAYRAKVELRHSIAPVSDDV